MNSRSFLCNSPSHRR